MYRGGEGKGGVETLEVTVTLAEYERIEKKTEELIIAWVEWETGRLNERVKLKR